MVTGGSTSSGSVVRPASASRIDSSRRLALAGLLNKWTVSCQPLNSSSDRNNDVAHPVLVSDEIYVYDERGRQLFARPSGPGANDGLHGHTGGSVSIRRGDYIYTYNENGYQISSMLAR